MRELIDVPCFSFFTYDLDKDLIYNTVGKSY